jgi:hypothetical protein
VSLWKVEKNNEGAGQQAPEASLIWCPVALIDLELAQLVHGLEPYYVNPIAKEVRL